MLSGNSQSGSWPNSIKEGCSLNLIHLHGNQITGRSPRSLTRCHELLLLNVRRNYVMDSFSWWLGELPELGVLVLRSNQLYGPLPSVEENSTTKYLQIVDLAENRFNGALPTNLFQSSKLVTDPAGRGGDDTLGAPLVEEPFPPNYEFVVDVAMKELYMNLPEITAGFVLIDLSNNRFHGPIPKTIGKLLLLHVLNMSHNDTTRSPRVARPLVEQPLRGDPAGVGVVFEVPRVPGLLHVQQHSFQGNSGLYGYPLPVHCDLTDSSSKSPAPAPPSAPSPSESYGDKFEVLGFAAAILRRPVISGANGGTATTSQPYSETIRLLARCIC